MVCTFRLASPILATKPKATIYCAIQSKFSPALGSPTDKILRKMANGRLNRRLKKILTLA